MSVDRETMYIERRVNPSKQTLKSLLEEIASHIASGDYTPSSSAVLITRDEEDETITFIFWGDEKETRELFDDASQLRKLGVQ